MDRVYGTYATFKNISVISFMLVEETGVAGVPRENIRPAANH
jgi:hypothetical protein